MSALSNRQIARAATIVVGGFLASGVLGLVRTAAFSVTFGASDALDAFYAAQRIPEALFVLVAGGALGSSFIPVFARYLTAGDERGAWRLASAVMSCVFLLATLLALVMALFAPVLVPALLEPSASLAQQALTTSLTQIMLVTVAIFSVSGLLMGILNAR
ncbi:MAG: lipid II flippase MurJ, partial [Chloroflexota bacterium]